MTLRRSGLALLGLLVITPLLGAALHHFRERERAWDLVRAAATAHERVSYAGTAASRRTRWHKPVRVTHDHESGRTRYSWSRRHGYVRRGPNSRTPDPAAWCLDLAALEENYRARLGGPTFFLGRPAERLLLLPRYGGRPELELIVDRDTSLPLQVASIGADGALYRTSAFRDVEIGPQRVEPRSRRWGWMGRPVPEKDVAAEAGFRPMRPAYLPPGFRCVEWRVSEWETTAVRMLFTDGVTAFELSQKFVCTPAQMETNLKRRMGDRGIERAMRFILSMYRRGLVQSDAGEGAAVVRCSKRFLHRTYRLRVGDLAIRLTTRDDLDREESLRVLRSLSAR